jgi:hypothetical protein
MEHGKQNLFPVWIGTKSAIDDLNEYLIQANSKSFMILVNGRIVMEEYFDGHTQSSRMGME